jgi:hypothetical protein
MRASPLVAIALLLSFAPAAWAQNPLAVISWGNSCPTAQTNQDFTGPAHYSMWIAVKNLTPADQNVGTQVHLFFAPIVADAWRFDNAGCQTGSRVSMNNLADTKSCPAMLGPSPMSITTLTYDPTSHQMTLFLGSYYDSFTPSAGVTYTIWNITFDHSHSIAGSDNDPSTCDGAAVPLTISISNSSDENTSSYLLTTQDIEEHFQFADPHDQFVTWNGDQPVAAQATTWGRIKSTYR